MVLELPESEEAPASKGMSSLDLAELTLTQLEAQADIEITAQPAELDFGAAMVAIDSSSEIFNLEGTR